MKKNQEEQPKKPTRAEKAKILDEALAWTTQPYLQPSDYPNLKKIRRLYIEGNFEEALDLGCSVDTVFRDAIPATIWVEIGGTLLPEGKKTFLKEQEIINRAFNTML